MLRNFEYYDPVEGTTKRMMEKDLDNKHITGHFYIVDPKDDE